MKRGYIIVSEELIKDRLGFNDKLSITDFEEIKGGGLWKVYLRGESLPEVAEGEESRLLSLDAIK